jgi:hypothetical protein
MGHIPHLIVSVADRLERFDHGSVLENGVQLIERTRRVGEVLFETLSKYQLSIADGFSEDKDDAVARRIV